MASKNIIQNLHFINAPAGSGKTYRINKKVSNLVEERPDVKILCITYTERAANVLKKRIESSDVYISTIHSFINYFMVPFYKHQEAIDLYFSLFKEELVIQIEKNKTKDVEDPLNKNSNYLQNKGFDKSDEITIAIIQENTRSIYYNEKKYNTIYYGGLSHDNLLKFSFEFLMKYPVLQFRLKEMFDYIFIDEVQDTHPSILNLFFESASNTSTQVFYFGDKMQEIYGNYDGSFEDKFEVMDNLLTQEFKINYRSTQQIVKILNNLYISSFYIQQTSKKGMGKIEPILYICSNIDNAASMMNKDTLILKLSNRSRFKRDDPNETMENLFNAMYNIYPDRGKVKIRDVLLPQKGEDSPDSLIKFFYTLDYILSCFENLDYADIIQMFNDEKFIDNKGVKQTLFTSNTKVTEHIHKQNISLLLSESVKIFARNDKTIGEVLRELVNIQLISGLFVEEVLSETDNDGDELYSKVLEIKFIEIKNLINFCKNQTVSTQHGVKGEGHASVCFYSEDSTKLPYVSMYKFFEMFSTMPSFNLDEFQEFYYDFKSIILEFESQWKVKISKILASIIDDTFTEGIDNIVHKYTGNIYFETIYKTDLKKYRDKRKSDLLPTKISIQKICKYDEANRVLIAYKLFYVGCSRATDELIVLVDKLKIKSFESDFITKMDGIGFTVKCF